MCIKYKVMGRLRFILIAFLICLSKLNGIWIPLFKDDFESSFSISKWTVIDSNFDGISWLFGRTHDLDSFEPPDYGSSYAYYSDDDAGSGSPPANEYLISPKFYLKNCKTLKLKFAFGEKSFYLDDTIFIKYKTVFCESLIKVIPLKLGSSGWDSLIFKVEIDIESLSIVFQYKDHGGWNFAVAFDNVKVEGYKGHDIAVLDAPFGGYGPIDSREIKVLVKNLGIYEDTFNLYAEINGIMFNSPQNVILSPDESKWVNFGFYNFSVQDTYIMKFYHDLESDSVLANDTLVKKYIVIENAWVIYDDGVPVFCKHWSEAGCGAGMKYVFFNSLYYVNDTFLYIDSVEVVLGWYGNELANFRLVFLDNLNSYPNYVIFDTSLIFEKPAGYPPYSFKVSLPWDILVPDTLYVFYIQNVSYSDEYVCLYYDENISKSEDFYWMVENYPFSPYYYISNYGGYWFIRLHAYSCFASNLDERSVNLEEPDSEPLKLLSLSMRTIKLKIARQFKRIYIELYNIEGRKIFSIQRENPLGNLLTIDLKKFKIDAGVYLVKFKLYGQKKYEEVKKLLIVR